MMNFNNLPVVVKNLIMLNVVVFIGTMFLPYEMTRMGNLFFFKSDYFQPFQIITSMFLHADFMHLLFNMLMLFFLAPMVEHRIGDQRFFTLYMLSGLGGSAFYIGYLAFQYYGAIDQIETSALAYNTVGSILVTSARGASGAIYGVMAAFATMYPRMKMTLFPIPIEIEARFLVLGLIAMGVYRGMGNVSDGVAHFAHVGGAVFGFLIVLVWGYAKLGKR